MEIEHTDSQTNRDKIASAFRLLIDEMGDDSSRPGVADTPKRMLGAFDELTLGYNQNASDILGTQFKSDYDEMVTVIGVPFVSLCEHHLMPFWGEASIGYIPINGRVVGLSKLPRLIHCFARRLQIQERFTQEIANAINDELSPLGVGVIVKATHSCMKFRGVKSAGEMRTSSMIGAFMDNSETRAEFLSLIS